MNKNITDVRGFKAWGAHIGIKSKRRDLALIVSEVPASAGAVFTTNQVVAAPVIVTRKHLTDGCAQAIVVTSGNANACTGAEGLKAAETVAKTYAKELSIRVKDVVVSSTGVIGERYPVEKAIEGIRANTEKLSGRNVAGAMAANAIMTTDTFQKEAFRSFEIDGKTINLGGIAKGSGMIHPNMATMLSFLVCDADIEPEMLQKALSKAVERSFNMISVDGDTSTNDMVVILSNGLAKNRRIKRNDGNYRIFLEQLELICKELAKSIVSDGEGATKFIEYQVVNAKTECGARKIIRTVSDSNLVKTAIFGRDPNWGRIVAAAGRAGVKINPNKLDVYVGNLKGLIMVAKDGGYTRFNRTRLKKMMKSSQIKIVIDLNQGKAQSVGWGTDFSYEYVRINAEYTT